MYFDCAISKSNYRKENLTRKVLGTFWVVLRKKGHFGHFGPFFDDNSIMTPNQSARNCQKV
jgi:hypothetical protein